MKITVKKNGTFTANTTIIAQANGKIQWQTGTPEYRELMQKLNVQICEYAQATCKAKEDIKSLNDKILYAVKSRTYYEDEVEGYKTQITDIRTKLADMKKVNDDEVEALDVDVNLYYAYRTYVRGEEDSATPNTYYRAFMEWCNHFGIVPTESTFHFIADKMGVRALGAHAIVKNGGEQFTDAKTPKQFIELYYRVVLELMKKRNLIKPFEFTYTLPVKTKDTAK